MPEVKIKRAYEAPSPSDGKRVLVDRLWPRGLSKEELKLHWWSKELAPSADLRRWFGHDVGRWEEFRKRYAEELSTHPEEVSQLRDLAAGGAVTLVFGAKDAEHNNAVVLKEYLEERAAA